MFNKRVFKNTADAGEGHNGHCRACGGDLYTYRECPRVILRCGECGKKFNIADYSEFIDDEFEEEMANVPMNRL
ncbi:dual CXXC motif small (seleno)protein [Maridesulfovibrio sp.]|uniref:dual CXXC motif small (seleno)protein n=1 Tax=Maridesulfovibrio sp. TaxID=2795000 RepID=UPI0029CA341E|nr:dual CXXC motif small (seleno)protein [Maridesulfovibrio sp.]